MKHLNPTNIFFFAAVFLSMCFFRIWFTILLIFAFAIILTYKTKKRIYCKDYCPVATLQVVSGHDGLKPVRKKFDHPLIIIAFFAALILITITYWNDSFMLWRSYFVVMVIMAAMALITQEVVGKRFWCLRVCPLGMLLGRIRRL